MSAQQRQQQRQRQKQQQRRQRQRRRRPRVRNCTFGYDHLSTDRRRVEFVRLSQRSATCPASDPSEKGQEKTRKDTKRQDKTPHDHRSGERVSLCECVARVTEESEIGDN